MIIPKKNRVEVYSYLFKEGTIVAKKDPFAKSHPQITTVKNLEVIKLMKGFTTRKFVKETFNWRYYYWTLTNEGIEYLREELHLPAQIIPATLKKTQRTARPAAPAPRSERPVRRTEATPAGAEGKTVPPTDFKPEFARRGGASGRGRGFAGARGGARAPRAEGGYRQ